MTNFDGTPSKRLGGGSIATDRQGLLMRMGDQEFMRANLHRLMPFDLGRFFAQMKPYPTPKPVQAIPGIPPMPPQGMPNQDVLPPQTSASEAMPRNLIKRPSAVGTRY